MLEWHFRSKNQFLMKIVFSKLTSTIQMLLWCTFIEQYFILGKNWRGSEVHTQVSQNAQSSHPIHPITFRIWTMYFSFWETHKDFCFLFPLHFSKINHSGKDWSWLQTVVLGFLLKTLSGIIELNFAFTLVFVTSVISPNPSTYKGDLSPYTSLRYFQLDFALQLPMSKSLLKC